MIQFTLNKQQSKNTQNNQPQTLLTSPKYEMTQEEINARKNELMRQFKMV